MCTPFGFRIQPLFFLQPFVGKENGDDDDEKKMKMKMKMELEMMNQMKKKK